VVTRRTKCEKICPVCGNKMIPLLTSCVCEKCSSNDKISSASNTVIDVNGVLFSYRSENTFFRVSVLNSTIEWFFRRSDIEKIVKQRWLFFDHNNAIQVPVWDSNYSQDGLCIINSKAAPQWGAVFTKTSSTAEIRFTKSELKVIHEFWEKMINGQLR